MHSTAPALPPLAAAIPMGKEISFTYTNWRGQTAVRRVVVLGWRMGSTEWHPSPQLLMCATDLDRGDSREFAYADIFQGSISH